MRWYSPRDYIEEEVVDENGVVVIKGELSARMKIPSNMWVEAWETAKPIPARRQRRLFDDTREAEKVKIRNHADCLHYGIFKIKMKYSNLLPGVHSLLIQISVFPMLYYWNMDKEQWMDCSLQMDTQQCCWSGSRTLC